MFARSFSSLASRIKRHAPNQTQNVSETVNESGSEMREDVRKQTRNKSTVFSELSSKISQQARNQSRNLSRAFTDLGAKVNVKFRSNHVPSGTASSSHIQYSKRKCCICLDKKSAPSSFCPSLPSCDHPSNSCKECTQEYIASQVRTSRNPEIACPNINCTHIYTYDDIIRLNLDDKSLANEFQQLQSRLAIESNPEFRWCAHPPCSSGQLHCSGSGKAVVMTCQACGKRTCTHHRIAWHEGQSCEQYDWYMEEQRKKKVINDEHILRTKMNSFGIKVCPKCKQGVQKNSGCDKMTCQRSAGGCGATFCWRCLADYYGPRGILVVGNSAHKIACPHYRPSK